MMRRKGQEGERKKVKKRPQITSKESERRRGEGRARRKKTKVKLEKLYLS